LILGTSAALYASPRHAATPSSHGKPFTLRSGRSDAPVRTGEINLATLPIATPSEIAASAKRIPTVRRPILEAQQAVDAQWAKTYPSALPHAQGRAVSARSPNFVGGGDIPELVNQADGINSTQAGDNCCFTPDPVIAAAPGYLFEGVNNLLEVFTTSYTQKFGPWTPDTFFAPLKHAGDSFLNPQITFDAERAVYVIAWEEIKGDLSADYIDLAISKTSSPSPLSNFYEYQIPATVSGASDYCDGLTLGYDYWGVWLTCVNGIVMNGGVEITGNRVFVFSTNAMLAGNITGKYAWYYDVPTDLNCSTSCTPAIMASPAIEDGVPNAEWVIATDSLMSVVSSNLTLCAFTNTHAIVSGGIPTGTCDFNALPLTYYAIFQDPQQIVYHGGRLYFTQTTSINCGSGTVTGILWADVVPQLTTVAAHNPQWVNGLVSAYTEANYWCFSNADAYYPVLSPSNERDVSLSFTVSSGSVFPSLGYTGRMAADAPGSMGQGGDWSTVVLGTNSGPGFPLGLFSTCALTTNLVTRGILYCVGAYPGANAWNTRLFQLRME
jgi:hypothetical protein